jgi:hypothetical protein
LQCVAGPITTGTWYAYGGLKATEYTALTAKYTDKTGWTTRSCTTEECNNPATFNPNAAAPAVASAFLLSAAAALALML